MADAMMLTHLQHVTRIMNFLTNSKEKVGREKQTVPHFEARLVLLEKHWNKFDHSHFNLLAHADELKGHEYFAKDMYTEVETTYINTIAELKQDIANLTPQVQVALGQDFQAPNFSNPVPTLRLPVLTLPTFSGKQEDWESFKQRFEAVLATHPTLPEVAKLQHLMGALQGAAASRLKGMAVIGDNFNVAWDRLKRRYDNTHLRLHSNIESMIDLPVMRTRNASDLSTLVDRAEEIVRALVSLNWPIEQCNPFLIHCICRKLDVNTRETWNIAREENEKAHSTYDHLIAFLERRIQSLDQARSDNATDRHKDHAKSKTSLSTKSDTKSISTHVARDEKNAQCVACDASHSLYSCQAFKELPIPERIKLSKEAKLCINCLGRGHFAVDCPSQKRCKACNSAHHTLLHLKNKSIPFKSKALENAHKESERETPAEPTTIVSANSTTVGRSILLATASVVLNNGKGSSMRIRALIDPAAERSFLTERVASSLLLTHKKISVSIIGVGSSVSAKSSREVSGIITSPIDKFFKHKNEFLVLPELTRLMPSHIIKSVDWPHIDGLTLADERYALPGRVDAILGADLYSNILREGLRRGPPNAPIAQQTVFGWVLIGQVGTQTQHQPISAFHVKLEPVIDTLLTKFWELEEIPAKSHLSEDEQYCEEYYKKTTYRDSSGRYCVRLPFKNQPVLPDIKEISLACLLRLEKRRIRNPNLDTAYINFMSEYISLGHMRLTPDNEVAKSRCYLPHHAVFRNNESKKIRVVFNASQRCGSGLALNDLLLPGPKLQSDIAAVLTRWRFYKFAFTTDIVKMFRQILVHPDDAKWQHILWRDNQKDRIRDYQAVTVTYGTAPAPFLAIRTLLQLAKEGEASFPEAAKILYRQIYVDDIFSGADTIELAQARRSQLIDLLRSAQMQLSKWAANDKRLLHDDPSFDSVEVPFDCEDTVSTLGLQWITSQDSFHYTIQTLSQSPTLTKRGILSETARLFDPLGFLAPTIIIPKIIMQDLWLEKVGWDDTLPADITTRWLEFRNSLPSLENIRIPRHVDMPSSDKWHIHGFSDASQRAYGAVIYAVSTDSEAHKPRLLLSKSKVAPVKTQSLPRLELCGALLLVRLTKFLLDSLNDAPASINFWSDSKVVLDWLKGHPSRWHVFVANRVSEIITTLPQAIWRHVPSQDNPADCVSRGLSPSVIQNFKLWWQGPVWLSHNPDDWPKIALPKEETELEIQANLAATPATDIPDSLIDQIRRFSSFLKIIRLIAYLLRWYKNLRLRRELRATSSLIASEIHSARFAFFRLIQNVYFKEEINCLTRQKDLPTKSPLRRLSPFICDKGLLRVGGRLQNSTLSFSEKHPVILPGKEILVRRLIEHAHYVTLHGGVKLMLSYLSRFCWILQGVRVIHSVFRRCVVCTRFSGRVAQQLMAPLPSYRVQPQRPFAFTGVDYAGPFPVRFSKGRGAKSVKGYVAVFICMVTRAVHLEVVSDLTVDAFLAAYGRFTSRRGLCSTIFSDNGTTFKGAAAELQRRFHESSNDMREIVRRIAEQGTEWKFIPPRAPHFGGLWEAAVKSFKSHLYKVVGESTLTFEELSTLITSIEACLNSRPICSTSSLGSDEVALTPAHFLVGTSLLSFPEPFSELDLTTTLYNRWLKLTQMRNIFWLRWKREMLNQFQQRNKWLRPKDNFNVGDVVLIKDESTPPRSMAPRSNH